MKGELGNMEFIGDCGKRNFSGGVAAEAEFKCVDDYTGKREELKTVPADKCLERKEKNVALSGEGGGSQEMIFLFS